MALLLLRDRVWCIIEPQELVVYVSCIPGQEGCNGIMLSQDRGVSGYKLRYPRRIPKSIEEYLRECWEHPSVILGIRHSESTRGHFQRMESLGQPVTQFSGRLPRQCLHLMSVTFLSKLHRCPPSSRCWPLTSCVLPAPPDYHTLTSAPYKNSRAVSY